MPGCAPICRAFLPRSFKTTISAIFFLSGAPIFSPEYTTLPSSVYARRKSGPPVLESGMAKTAAFSEILTHLDQFFDVCGELGLHAQAEAGRFGVYRSRIGRLGDEIGRLRKGEDKMPIYRKLAE